MNKSHPVRRIAGETGLTRLDAEAAFDSVLSGTTGLLAREGRPRASGASGPSA